MPWKEASAMSLRLEFVRFAMSETANIRSLCRRYGISAKTGYKLGLVACSNQRVETVQWQLITTFRRYGLPQRILSDNGGPWGCCGNDAYTELGVWMVRLGIGSVILACVIHKHLGRMNVFIAH